MKIHHVTQGTPEWLEIRKGKATASEFSKIITPTGKLSSQADAYARKLARECLFDEPEELKVWPSKAMQWGTKHEPEAREAFMLETGYDVQRVGFVEHEEYPQLGCSPDGLVVEPEWLDHTKPEYISGLEIKCPSIDILTEWLLAQDADPSFFPPEYLPQVHGSMVVTGLRRWEFCGYFPGAPMCLATARWDAYTDKMQAAMFAFAKRYEAIAPDVWRVLGKGSE